MTNETIENRIALAQTLLMSVVILITAWCSYKASYWSGVSSFELAAAHTMSIRATEKTLIAEKKIIVDTMLAVNVANAVIERKQAVVDFYLTHLPADSRNLINAWLSTKPLQNKDAPAHPLEIRGYTEEIVKRYDAEADRLRDLEESRSQKAFEAKSVSDAYTFKTVVLASVLFIGGIVPNFISLRIRIALLCLDYIIATVTFWQLFHLLIRQG
jgi:hypothetical protein